MVHNHESLASPSYPAYLGGCTVDCDSMPDAEAVNRAGLGSAILSVRGYLLALATNRWIDSTFTLGMCSIYRHVPSSG